MAPTPGYCPDGCGALVLRARTEALKWQLLNIEPDPAGNTAVRIDHQDNVFARGLRKGEQPADFETVYMPHKATCQVEARRTAQRARQPATSVTQLDAYRTARALRAAGKRSRRARRPQPPITGIRYDPERNR
jgi:hypothetical protein